MRTTVFLVLAALIGLMLGHDLAQRAHRYAKFGPPIGLIGSSRIHRVERRQPQDGVAQALCAVVLPALIWRYGLGSLATLRFVALFYLLVWVALIDIETGEIPDRQILSGIVFFAWMTVARNGDVGTVLLGGLLGGLAVAGPLLGLVLLADRIFGRETMGGGDVKLFFVCGMYFGWQLGLLHLILSCVTGLALVPLVRKDGSRELPFAPAICVAGALVMLFGEGLIAWYLSLFGL